MSPPSSLLIVFTVAHKWSPRHLHCCRRHLTSPLPKPSKSCDVTFTAVADFPAALPRRCHHRCWLSPPPLPNEYRAVTTPVAIVSSLPLCRLRQRQTRPAPPLLLSFLPFRPPRLAVAAIAPPSQVPSSWLLRKLQVQSLLSSVCRPFPWILFFLSCLAGICRLVVLRVGSGWYLSALGAFGVSDAGGIPNLCRHVVHPWVRKRYP